MGWKDTIQKEPSSGGWRDSVRDDTPADPKYSATESAVMHGLNQATGGFSDELAGAGEVAGQMVGLKGAGGPMKDMSAGSSIWKSNGLGPSLDWSALRDAYLSARDHERSALKQQTQEHPTASVVGDIGGAIASPLNKLAGGASLVGGGAALGGINGLGHSDAASVSGLVKDTAVGAGAGGLMGAGLSGLGSLGSAAKNTLEDVATAPIGIPGDRGLVARGLDKIHDLGAKGNSLVDRAVKTITPASGDEGVDAAVNVASRLGRYGVAGKAQGVLDAAEHGPKMVQHGASLASRGFDSIVTKLQGTKYAPVLANAAKRGGPALGATHFILQQTDPQYRQAVSDDEESQ